MFCWFRHRPVHKYMYMILRIPSNMVGFFVSYLTDTQSLIKINGPNNIYLVYTWGVRAYKKGYEPSRAETFTL